MGQMIYIIGAAVLAGMVILLVLQMQFLMSDSGIEASLNGYVLTTAETFKQILRNDVREIGMAMPKPDECLLEMKPNKLKYKINTALEAGQSNIETISITTRPWPDGKDPTPQNPHDFQVIRKIQAPNQTEDEALIDPYPITGVAVASINDTIFWYYDKNLNITNDPSNVRFVHFKFKIESKEPYNGDFIYAIIEERVFLKNVWQF